MRPEGLLISSSTWLVVYEPIKQTQVDQGSHSPSTLDFPFIVQDILTFALKVIVSRLCSPRIKLALVSCPAFSMLLARLLVRSFNILYDINVTLTG